MFAEFESGVVVTKECNPAGFGKQTDNENDSARLVLCSEAAFLQIYSEKSSFGQVTCIGQS